jgi:hypothetical protein
MRRKEIESCLINSIYFVKEGERRKGKGERKKGKGERNETDAIPSKG